MLFKPCTQTITPLTTEVMEAWKTRFEEHDSAWATELELGGVVQGDSCVHIRALGLYHVVFRVRSERGDIALLFNLVPQGTLLGEPLAAYVSYVEIASDLAEVLACLWSRERGVTCTPQSPLGPHSSQPPKPLSDARRETCRTFLSVFFKELIQSMGTLGARAGWPRRRALTSWEPLIWSAAAADDTSWRLFVC